MPFKRLICRFYTGYICLFNILAVTGLTLSLLSFFFNSVNFLLFLVLIPIFPYLLYLYFIYSLVPFRYSWSSLSLPFFHTFVFLFSPISSSLSCVCSVFLPLLLFLYLILIFRSLFYHISYFLIILTLVLEILSISSLLFALL